MRMTALLRSSLMQSLHFATVHFAAVDCNMLAAREENALLSKFATKASPSAEQDGTVHLHLPTVRTLLRLAFKLIAYSTRSTNPVRLRDLLQGGRGWRVERHTRG